MNVHRSLKKLNSELFNNLAYLESRKGTQSKAISYVTDKSKSLVTPETFQFGTKKLDYRSPINFDNKKIPNNESILRIRLSIMNINRLMTFISTFLI